MPGISIGDSPIKNAYIGTTPLKEIYVGTTKVRPSGRNPGANTIAYFPFKDDQLDKVGNCTLSATGTKQTIGYRFTSSSSNLGITIPSNKQTSRFHSCWIKCVSTSSHISSILLNYGTMRFFYAYSGNTHTKAFGYWKDSSNIVWSSKQTIDLTKWFHLAYGCDSSNNYRGWINGNLVFSGQASPQRFASPIDWFQGGNATINYSDFILEDRLRTNEELVEYYNSTKGNYGL